MPSIDIIRIEPSIHRLLQNGLAIPLQPFLTIYHLFLATTPSSEHQKYTLDLSREEQWVLHHVLLDRIELEAQAPADTDPPPITVYRVFEKLEAGTHQFSRYERQGLRDELHKYAEAMNTPERDQPIVERLLDKLQQSEPNSSTVEPVP